jgi:dUTP pyrophosphatase
MFNKLKEIKQMMSLLKDIKESGEVFENTEEMFTKLGVDKDFIENELGKYFIKSTELKFTKFYGSAFEQKYNYETDSGFDLHSIEEKVIPPFGRALVRTGLKFEIPIGLELQVRPKSGLALKEGLTVLNTPGTVDQGYTGEVMVIIFNTNNTEYTVKKGMKIAQGVLCPVHAGRMVSLHEVVEITEKERGNKGFGSTGI